MLSGGLDSESAERVGGIDGRVDVQGRLWVFRAGGDTRLVYGSVLEGERDTLDHTHSYNMRDCDN